MNSSLVQVIPWIGVLGMIIAVITFVGIRRHPAGNEVMQGIAEKIHLGAMVFLKREYQIIAVFMVIIFVALTFVLGIWTGVAYLCGAIASMSRTRSSRYTSIEVE